MSAGDGQHPDDPSGRVRLYVAGCVLLAVVVVGAVLTNGPGAARDTPAPWLLVLLWAATVVAGTAKIGLPARGVGGVREYTSLLEIAAVLLMVFLDPAWAVTLAVTASLLAEAFANRRDVLKIIFNSASEAIAIAGGGAVYHALGGVAVVSSPSGIGAALLAAAVYIAVNVATFLGLVAILSGHVWQAVRSGEMRSSLLVSCGIGTTGVLTAVLVVAAPWALPLLVVPAVLDHLRARSRQESLELAASKEAAEAANQAKSEFLSRMSHELRTPLTSILGFAQMLEIDDDLDDAARKHVDFILRSGRHLTTIIDEVLDLSQIEAGRMTFVTEAVDVRNLVGESLDLVRPLASERDIRMRITESSHDNLHVAADPQRLRQVLLNLLSNAIKYNREAGHVTITLNGADDQVRVAISDSGLGIAPDDMQWLFVPFERLGSGASNVQGTGLGLSISRHFVEAMGGRLEVFSDTAQGSTFSVVLPRAEPAT